MYLPIDLNEDTSITVPIEIIASSAVFVAEALAICALIMNPLSKSLRSSCHLVIKSRSSEPAQHFYMLQSIVGW